VISAALKAVKSRKIVKNPFERLSPELFEKVLSAILPLFQSAQESVVYGGKQPSKPDRYFRLSEW